MVDHFNSEQHPDLQSQASLSTRSSVLGDEHNKATQRQFIANKRGRPRPTTSKVMRVPRFHLAPLNSLLLKGRCRTVFLQVRALRRPSGSDSSRHAHSEIKGKFKRVSDKFRGLFSDPPLVSYPSNRAGDMSWCWRR